MCWYDIHEEDMLNTLKLLGVPIYSSMTSSFCYLRLHTQVYTPHIYVYIPQVQYKLQKFCTTMMHYCCQTH